MKKRDWFLIMAAVIFVQMLFIVRPFFRQHEKAPYEVPQYYKVHEEEDKSWPQKVVSDPVAFFTIVLTAFTGGLYWATRSLWRSTENLVIGAEKTAAMQLRAYVLCDNATLERGGIPGLFIATVFFKNFGSTIAHGIVTRRRMYIGVVPDGVEKPEGLLAKPFHADPPFVAGPGQESSMAISFDYYVATNELQFGTKNARTVFVDGDIAYVDAFEQQRCTKFCFYALYDGSGYRFIQWKSGNEAE